jgi:hypothetical protein
MCDAPRVSVVQVITLWYNVIKLGICGRDSVLEECVQCGRSHCHCRAFQTAEVRLELQVPLPALPPWHTQPLHPGMQRGAKC